jgi:hypothetical protein
VIWEGDSLRERLPLRLRGFDLFHGAFLDFVMLANTSANGKFNFCASQKLREGRLFAFPPDGGVRPSDYRIADMQASYS